MYALRSIHIPPEICCSVFPILHKETAEAQIHLGCKLLIGLNTFQFPDVFKRMRHTFENFAHAFAEFILIED